MHYPIQSRELFAQWLDDGCPAVATIELNQEERQVPAQVMLRRMRRCSDPLPSALVETIGDRLGLGSGLRGRTYGEAARRLMAAEVSTTP